MLAIPFSLVLALASGDPIAGSTGLDDPYYPGLGNGGFDVAHYAIHARVAMPEGSLSAESTMSATALHALSRYNLDFHGLTIESVHVDGAPAQHSRAGSELTITPASPIAEGAAFETRIKYAGQPEPVPTPGLPIPAVGWLHVGDEINLMSEPSGASSFYPVNDHPRDKATYTFRITVPSEYTAAANGLLIETTEGEGTHTFHFEASDPMASYLATIAIGKYDVVVEEGPNGLPLVHYFSRQVPEESRAPFAKTSEMIEFFSERLGPYPFESFGGVLSGTEIPGALETQTLPVYGAQAAGESTIAHELAHQWFGNCVSPTTWRDIWINEGLAEFAAWLWIEHSKGAPALERRLARMRSFLGMIPSVAPSDPGADQLFGVVVYVRGPWAMHELRHQIGDEQLFEILKEWVSRNHDHHAGVADFVDLVEELAGEQASTHLGAWLYDAKAPEPIGPAGSPPGSPPGAKGEKPK